MRFLIGLFAAAMGLGQVRVEVRADRTEYLAGEPMFAVVEVTNRGSAPVGFSICLGQVDFAVEGQQKRAAPDYWGCWVGHDSAWGFVASQAPTMGAGETVAFWYLLKGYRMGAGEYGLRVSGEAGVPRGVAGRAFDVSLKVRVRESNEEELKARYEPWVREAAGFGCVAAEESGRVGSGTGRLRASLEA